MPKTVTPYHRTDEACPLGAGREVVVTLRLPDSGGRFRFHIRYGKPPPLHERLSELARKKLGLRRKNLQGRWKAIITEPIQIPPA